MTSDASSVKSAARPDVADNRSAVIIGGGIIGCMAAWYLRDAGQSVTVVDSGRIGGAASHANCGYISPSHVFPLAMPGTVQKALAGMLRRESALRIRPRLSPALWKWLLRFSMRCNDKDATRAGVARNALLQSSAELYRDLITAQGLDCEYETRGLLFVYSHRDEYEAFRAVAGRLADEYGVHAVGYEADALVDLEPALKPGVAGGWHFPGDSHVKPDRLMAELRRILTERNVEFIEDCAVTGVRSEAGRAVAALTQDGRELVANDFLIAAGALSPQLSDWLGVSLPIQPGKGYSITMARPTVCPRIPMILEDCHVAITPFRDTYRVGSTMEFAGYDSTLNRARLEYLRKGARQYLVDPLAEPVHEEWCGWRPMVPDGIPYIDRGLRFPNVWTATGHSMLGLSMGAASGRLAAELMNGDAPHLDPTPYRIQR